ncbi:hypothetical protein M5V91_14615 [Cytobacillus pseudoceanisediminis]|uniref:hypothetical protein n=1 Tax=Cytobacillus pseudoceanisediminis TaxID=3051614 RepID=UPI0021899BB4|nr:hypothetical protein [Cytobacillus pseudoceanisediminis]UQX52296.1 hypothetical protein M5V91_14615 [Cytobacillus pseudoceanisediminis]
MKFADHLTKAHIQQFNQLRRFAEDKEEKPKSQEKLSRRDLEDLMGTRRDTYKRVNGAVRRK